MSDKARYYYRETPGVVKTFTFLTNAPREAGKASPSIGLPVTFLLIAAGIAALVLLYTDPEWLFGSKTPFLVLVAFLTFAYLVDRGQRMLTRDRLAEERKKETPTDDSCQVDDAFSPPEYVAGESIPPREAVEESLGKMLKETFIDPGLSGEELAEAEALLNADGEGVEFNFDSGEVTRITSSGKRNTVGAIADIAGFRFRDRTTGHLGSYDYVVTWKNPLRPVLAFSPFYTRPEPLAVYRDTIVPRLEELLDDYRRREPESESPAQPPAAPLPTSVHTALFRHDGWEYERVYRNEPLTLFIVFICLLVWLALSSYGWLGTAILGVLVLVSGYIAYGEDKRLVVNPHTRSIIVYTGTGSTTEEYSFNDFERMFIQHWGSLNIAMIQVKGRMGISLVTTFDRDKAIAAVNEICAIMNLDPAKVFMMD